LAHQRIEFSMPCSEVIVFDAFHHHRWRMRWDSLVSATHVVGGAPCPYVGAVTENTGAGALRGLSMRTQFVSYDPPRVAAAAMLGRSFPFTRWAASMRHRATGPSTSLLIYTYSFEVGPPLFRWFLEPIVKWFFDRQTRRRFERLQRFLALHGDEVARWQKDR
jgi:Polyketide cyclase / dehydrase and lipid transport